MRGFHAFQLGDIYRRKDNFNFSRQKQCLLGIFAEAVFTDESWLQARYKARCSSFLKYMKTHNVHCNLSEAGLLVRETSCVNPNKPVIIENSNRNIQLKPVKSRDSELFKKPARSAYDRLPKLYRFEVRGFFLEASLYQVKTRNQSWTLCDNRTESKQNGHCGPKISRRTSLYQSANRRWKNLAVSNFDCHCASSSYRSFTKACVSVALATQRAIVMLSSSRSSSLRSTLPIQARVWHHHGMQIVQRMWRGSLLAVFAVTAASATKMDTSISTLSAMMSFSLKATILSKAMNLQPNLETTNSVRIAGVHYSLILEAIWEILWLSM